MAFSTATTIRPREDAASTSWMYKALRPWFPAVSAVGSGLAMMILLTTLSAMFTTPGWEPSLGGFPALSGPVAQLPKKDVVLLGAAIWPLGDPSAAASR